jgi:enoyl-CoA hydratase/carnithine racemase
VEDNLSDVLDAQIECLTSPDFMEAVAARLEKRAPVFSGS